MALYQRNGIYYAKISIPGRKPVRISTGTKDRQKAQEYHDQEQAKLWRVTRLGEKQRRTWDEAALKWLQEKKDKRSYRDDLRYVRFFTDHFRGLYLDEITRDMVDDLLTRHVKSTDRTRDLYVALIRGIFRRAMREWEWIDRVPAFRTYQKGKKGRVRWLTEEQVQVLVQELPAHLRPVMLFSLATGVRMGNALGLRWADIDLTSGVALIERTKNDDPLTVPLNRMARDVLDTVHGILCMSSPIAGSHCDAPTRGHGERRSSELVSLTSAGTICATHGQVGCGRRACRHGRSKRWRAGSLLRWPIAMPTSMLTICNRTRPK